MNDVDTLPQERQEHKDMCVQRGQCARQVDGNFTIGRRRANNRKNRSVAGHGLSHAK